MRHATLKTGWLIKSTGAEGDFTSRQSQTQTVSHFPRTAIVTPLEVHIKQNYKDEARNIALYAKKHDTALIAPNGKVSNLTPEQWLAVRLQSFKTWFGDWENDPENASKIVDENGEPLVVYHGTARSKPISIFKSGKSGYLGPGIYFTPEKRTASKYTGMYGDGLVYEGFVNMRNPLAISYADKPAKVILDAVKEGVYEKRIAAQGNESQLLKKADLTKLRKKGYDGIVWAPRKALDEGSFQSGEMLLFESNQIKSATDNRGTFDGGQPDISFSVVGENAANWEKIKHLAFRGRDDGKLRVELDASHAKIKGFPKVYPVYDTMRKLVDDGVYDSVEHLVYSSLKFIEDITETEKGEKKKRTALARGG